MITFKPNLKWDEPLIRVNNSLFPVSYSTLTCEALIAYILPLYPIGEVKHCQFWHRGLSDVYSVETEDQAYFLRISHQHWRSKVDIDFELEFLNYLHKNNIPVAYPLATLDEQFSIEINAPEGKRYGVLFVQAPGEVAIGDLNLNQSFKLGEIVAQIHQVSQNFKTPADRQPLTLDYLLDESLTVITPFLQNRPRDFNDVMEVAEELQNQLQVLPQTPPYWGVCWGDPHSGNAHFTLDNQITLFDFDQCGYGWRAFDIAKFLQVSLQSGLSQKVRDAFVRGYEQINPLTELEKNSIQGLTQTAHIWAWAISIINARFFNYSRLDSCYFNRHIEQLKRLHSPDWQ